MSAELQIVDGKRPSYTPPHVRIGTLPLATIIFFCVSGGPFGIEGSVHAAGFFYAILGVIFMPLLWSVPEALVVSELGSAFPEASGSVAWVEEAFGSAAGWMAGKNNWVSGCVDNAVYPVLFLNYILRLGGFVFQGGLRFLVLASVCCVLGYINWLGLRLVGKITIVIGVLTVLPFLVMVIIGAFDLDPSRWLERPSEEYAEQHKEIYDGLFPHLVAGGIIWRPFVNNLFWNFNNFDHAAHFAGMVDDPGKTYPRAMFIAVVMVVVAYLLPLLVAIGATDSTQDDWKSGYLSQAASEIGGKWLGSWIVCAAGVSNIAMFQAELSKDSLLLSGMAERGFLPKFLESKSRHGTPTYSILICLVVIICLQFATFATLIELTNFNYSIALLMEFVAFIKLRIAFPNMTRPFRVRLGTFGCILLVIPPMALLVFIMFLASYKTIVAGVVVNLFAFFLYHFSDRAQYSQASQQEQDVSVAYRQEDNLAIPPID